MGVCGWGDAKDDLKGSKSSKGSMLGVAPVTAAAGVADITGGGGGREGGLTGAWW